MTDIALAWDTEAFGADLSIEDGALATDDGLRTAILVSLFTDARAGADDVLPQPGGDRRGWWGDALNSGDGDAVGSKLWLLSREKITSATIQRAREACVAALRWLVDDKVASAVDVEVELLPPETLAYRITIDRPNGPARQRFDFTWAATR